MHPAHRCIDEGVAGAVECGDGKASLCDLGQECLALCIIIDELLSGRDEIAAAPAACGHLDRIKTISDDLVEHFCKGDLSENISADRKFHYFILLF